MFRPFLVILLILMLLLKIEFSGGLNSLVAARTKTQVADFGQFSLWQKSFVDRINLLLPGDQAGLLSGILLGEQRGISHNLQEVLKATSTIHVAVVSGQNLSLMAGFVMSLTKFLGRKKTIVLSLLVAIGYSLLTGFQIPVIRALIMVSAGFLAQLLGRDKDSSWILFLTGYVMVLYQPAWLFSISFQLSFLATLGAVVLAPKMLDTFSAVPEIIREDLVVSLAVQLLTWPVIAINFHQFSVIGILANLFILWTVSPTMIFGMVALFLSYLWLGLGTVAAIIPGVLISYFIYITSFLSKLPWAMVKTGEITTPIWLGYYLLLGGVVSILIKRRQYKLNIS